MAKPATMRSNSIVRSDFLLRGATVFAGALVGCGGSGGTPSSNPSPKPTASDLANVTVGSKTSYSITSTFVGLSYEKVYLASGLFISSDTSLIGCFERLGKSLLRFGGNTLDQTTYVSTGAGGVTGQVAPADINALATFLTSVGWKVIYGINLGSNTAENAAAEAAYAIEALGSNLYGFELGNQPDLYSANGTRSSTYTFTDFISEWQSYVSAIKTAAPGAKFVGPAVSSENIQTWTVPFAQDESSEIILLTQHYYRGNGASSSSTMAELLAPDPALVGDFTQLFSAAASAKISAGYRMAETNSFSDGGAIGVSDAYGTALWALDYMMLGAQNGCVGFNFHGGGDSGGYTPIADSEGSVVEVRPEYYALLLAAQIAPGAVLSVTTETSLPFTAYAVSGSDGATYVVLINKGATTAASVIVNLPTTASQGTTLMLAGTGLGATSGTTLGGTTVSASGQWSPNASSPLAINGTSFQLSVPAASALLVRCK